MRFMPKLNYMAFTIVFFIYYNADAQIIKGKVINQFTNEPVPYASVYWKIAGHGGVTDSLGLFKLQKSSAQQDTIVVSYTGYEDLLTPFDPTKAPGLLVLNLSAVKLGSGVVVKSKYNKGLRWWKKIVENKPNNNPYQYNNYSYELYNKLELDINNIKREDFTKIKLLRPFSFILNNIDSSSDVRPFLPIYLTETLSDYYYSNTPYKVREEIKAAQTQGINNETVMQFLGGVNQKINTYDDYMNLFGKEFISPLSKVGDKYYNYKGADTQTVNAVKYYHLFFTPKQEGSNTFSGDCWIHSTTWAVQRINLNISATADINHVKRLGIVQEFAMNDNKKWVFYKDKFIADLSPLSKEKLSFTGRKTSMYRNVVVDKTEIIEKLNQNTEATESIVLKDAKRSDPAFWDVNRHEPLSLNENKIYTMIDTLKKIPLFKTYSNRLEFIFDGHKKLGTVEIGPWYKWISSNQHEKLRLRFDVGTTAKFSKNLRLFGYLAYGFKDNAFKGKAAAAYKIHGYENWTLGASYTKDLDNGRARYREDEDATVDNMFSQLIRRPGIKQKFLGIEEYKFTVAKDWPFHINTQLGFTKTNYETFAPLPSKRFFIKGENKNVTNSEAIFKVRFAPGEKEIITHRKTFRIKSKNLPVVEARYAVAIPKLFNSEYSYQKLSGTLTQSFRLPRWGKVDLMAYGGKYWGDSIPFMLLEIHPGNEIYYYNKNAFNLMNRFEYFSDSYAGLNLEYNFEKKLINLIPFLRKTNVRQFVNIKTVWGDLSSSNKRFNRVEFGPYRMKTLNGNNYTEIGTGLDNIFKYFRLDLVWRLAPQSVRSKANVAQNFGVFGSFKLQF